MTESIETNILAAPPADLAESHAGLDTIKRRVLSGRLSMSLAAKERGASAYTLVKSLSENLKGALPTAEKIKSDSQQLQRQVGASE